MSKPPEPARRALGKGLSALLPARSAAGGAPATAKVDDRDYPSADPSDRSEPGSTATGISGRTIWNNWLSPSACTASSSHWWYAATRERYQLVAGERRWRAAKLAELQHVPVVLQDIPDERLLEITLIENVQREDLNPIELAQAFDRMARELDLNHEEIGRRTGKDRSTVANAIRLLQLPPDVQQLVAERRLSAGHARCLLSLPNDEMRRKLAERSVAQGLSVRQLERITKRMTEAQRSFRCGRSDRSKRQGRHRGTGAGPGNESPYC